MDPGVSDSLTHKTIDALRNEAFRKEIKTKQTYVLLRAVGPHKGYYIAAIWSVKTRKELLLRYLNWHFEHREYDDLYDVLASYSHEYPTDEENYKCIVTQIQEAPAKSEIVRTMLTNIYYDTHESIISHLTVDTLPLILRKLSYLELGSAKMPHSDPLPRRSKGSS